MRVLMPVVVIEQFKEADHRTVEHPGSTAAWNGDISVVSEVVPVKLTSLNGEPVVEVPAQMK